MNAVISFTARSLFYLLTLTGVGAVFEALLVKGEGDHRFWEGV